LDTKLPQEVVRAETCQTAIGSAGHRIGRLEIHAFRAGTETGAPVLPNPHKIWQPMGCGQLAGSVRRAAGAMIQFDLRAKLASIGKLM